MQRTTKRISSLMLAMVLVACEQQGTNAQNQGSTAASTTTQEANADVARRLPLADQADFEQARRGLIAQADTLVLKRADDGREVWNQDAYAFLDGEAPATANPSLWRQEQLNAIHGLFEVTEGIYQLRGYDLANMTLIRGDTGWIVVDPLTVEQTAAAAWRFAMQHLEQRPITAILYTHSHVDHFGGVTGLVSREDVAKQGIRVVAPAGFTDEATSENVLAGVGMQRRASYQYGRRLPRSPNGHIGLGLGKAVPFGGDIGFIAPTDTIEQTGQALELDGVQFEFQHAPGSEAPAEFTFYLPQFKAFCGAEVVSRNLHNIYTLRGAKVRDALRWAGYIEEARKLFGDRAEIYFGAHQWPIWGQQDIQVFMKRQRDTYKYIHDQTLRMANLGYTPREIAEQISMPASLDQSFANRGYYGTVKHNAKAVYQFYFGWYDGNPANLDPLPPEPAANKYVAAMGGLTAVLSLAQAAYDSGEYRWAAEVLNHAVFADPDSADARELLAKTYTQLGFQAESGPWRDVYLSGAYELRNGGPEQGVNMTDAVGLLAAIPPEQFFDAMAARLNGPKAEDKQLSVNFEFTDLGVGRHLWIENAVLHHEALDKQPADATLKLTHALFLKLVTGTAGVRDTLLSDDLDVDGSRIDLVRFFTLFDKPDGRFAIVTP